MRPTTPHSGGGLVRALLRAHALAPDETPAVSLGSIRHRLLGHLGLGLRERAPRSLDVVRGLADLRLHQVRDEGLQLHLGGRGLRRRADLLWLDGLGQRPSVVFDPRGRCALEPVDVDRVAADGRALRARRLQRGALRLELLREVRDDVPFPCGRRLDERAGEGEFDGVRVRVGHAVGQNGVRRGLRFSRFLRSSSGVTDGS
jgi:hypothetical protein